MSNTITKRCSWYLYRKSTTASDIGTGGRIDQVESFNIQQHF